MINCVYEFFDFQSYDGSVCFYLVWNVIAYIMISLVFVIS